MESEKMSIGKSLALTLAVIAAVAAIVGLLMVLRIPMWIPLLGLTVWSTIGMPMDMKSIAKVWISASVALLAGYMLGHITQLGIIAIVLAVICVFLLIFGIVSSRFSMAFNMITAIFLTACTAEGVSIEAVPAIKGLIFGFVVFGLLPNLAVTVLAKKKAQA